MHATSQSATPGFLDPSLASSPGWPCSSLFGIIRDAGRLPTEEVAWIRPDPTTRHPPAPGGGAGRGLARMVEEGRDCLEVLDQVAAARAALGRVASVVLEGHVHQCVTDAVLGDEPARRAETLDALLGVLERYGAFGRSS
ncbi:MAG: metal-sensitive transcriptional regulator [bacterium]